MQASGTVQRLLGGVATCLLLGVGAWQIVISSAPTDVLLLSVALVIAAGGAAALTLKLRLAERVKAPLVVLAQGLVSVGIATGVLWLLAPYLRDSVPLVVATFLAVLLTVNPATRPSVLISLWLSALGALAAVWLRIGAVTSHGIGGLVAVELLVGSLPVLAYTNWSLTDRHSQNQTRRMRTIAEAARHVGGATTVRDVVKSALLVCRDTYAQATWGAVLLSDAHRRWLVSSPMFLGPSGVEAARGADVRIGPGEGVSGTVFATGRAMLLATRRDIAAVYAGTSQQQSEALRLLGGGTDAASLIASPMHSLEGRITGVLVLNSHLREHAWDEEDLTVVQAIADQVAVAVERARLYELQQARAATDALTGVQNRRAFDELLNGPSQGPLALLAIDVDNLKTINDQYGHEAGDELLLRVATMLAGQTRQGDLFARIGGDEFVAVLFGADAREAAAIAERMRASLQGIALPHGPAQVSIGIAATGPTASLRTVWSAADAALAAAKSTGRDRIQGSVNSGREAHVRRLQDVKAVLEDVSGLPARIRPLFQPVVRLQDLSVAGYEALARLSLNGSARASGVDDVFAAAGRLGRLRDLDWLCRRRALETAKSLPSHLPLFVNVSAVALLDPVHPVDQMLLLLRAVDRDPSTLVLDFTERETGVDARRLRYVLAAYREHGIRFAIDDVGDGNATLDVLATMMPDYIKLAPKMTARMSDVGARAAIGATLAFARESRSVLIAEGVERRDVAERLVEAGVEFAQGVFFAAPAPLGG
jgi:diguanylate cyclase (GGDEF)-like protein